MGRIADWIRAQTTHHAVRAALRDVRELELEVIAMLDKLSTAAAREAKRQARARREALEAPESPDPDQLALPVAPPSTDLATVKAELRRRAFGRRPPPQPEA